jgi:HAD superfamily hydrolase (TIGR01490 family)
VSDNTLAIFDLDGTITRHDTLWPFIRGYLWRNPVRLWRLAPCLLPLLRFVCGQRDRGVLKGAIIRLTLGGVPRERLQKWAQEFAKRLLSDGLYAEALACIEVHRRSGAHLVLLSASTDIYVPEISRALGFNACLCTEVRWRSDGSLEGSLSSANRRGPEKARCVNAVLAERQPRYSHAYGNSKADLEHLRLVSAGTYVNGSERDLVGMPNVRTVRWRTPAGKGNPA